ncbi:serine endopeptidase [Podospora didyma]|uniref:Serine endopeptidase n=1 Tax=Podospora didyma TaxID=330526 RepID=A0AAE0N326_9PEZI|nr:serine endopeptidase [Podospora didyma]
MSAMFKSSIFKLLFALSLAGWAVGTQPPLDNGNSDRLSNGTSSSPMRFIIEFQKGTNHDSLRNLLAARKGFKIIKSFKSDIFSGVSVESLSDSVDTLEAIHSVAKVWRSRKVMLEKHNSTLERVFANDASAPKYNIHGMTGVDQLHAEGTFGKGAKVGVVDTGTAYDHPALGGCFGHGCKVAGGWDFIGNSSYPFGNATKMPDADPYDQLGHGTHISGIIIGKSEFFTGVAPEATLYSYKVFGTVDAVYDDVLIEAFLRAEEDGVDIITASIIGYSGWSENAWAVVGSRLVERGIVVICAAGNWGTSAGPFFHSNGASGELVLSVASVEASQRAAPAFEALFHAGRHINATKIAYYRSEGAFPRTIEHLTIIPLSGNIAAENEACDPLPEDTRNLTGIVILIRRGGCSEFQKQANLEAFGAQYILMFNDEEAIGDPFFIGDTFAAIIEARAGAAIIDAVKAGMNVTANFDLDPLTNYVGMIDPASGKPSDFSSWGGLYDLQVKPDIAAPGGRVFSTALGGKYETQSGTSQAAPYIAGVAALWIGKFGGRAVHGPGFAKELIAKIIQSGAPVPGARSDGSLYGFIAPVMQMGNGIVDATKVLRCKTSLSFAKFGLNDTAHFKPTHTVDITNNGPAAVKYDFGFIPAAGLELWVPYDPEDVSTPRIKYEWRELEPTAMVPSITFPTGEFVVQPGETKTATFTFDYPKGLSNIPAYSGKIMIGGDNNEVLSVPYFGIASNLRADIGGQFQPGTPYFWSGPQYPYATIEEKNYFSFNLSIEAGDYVQAHARFLWGVRELRWDIFDANWQESQWTYPPVVGQQGYIGSVAYYSDSGGSQGSHWQFDPATDNANDTTPFPEMFLYRTAPALIFEPQFWWLGKMADGTHIPVGNYTMRFSALMPFGDPTVSADWDKVVHSFSVIPL